MFLVKQESNSNSKLSGSASQFLEPFRFENLKTVSVQRKQKHRKGAALCIELWGAYNNTTNTKTVKMAQEKKVAKGSKRGASGCHQ